MKNKAGNILLGVGFVLLAAALILFLLNQREARRAEQSVEAVLPQMLRQMEEPAASASAAPVLDADTMEIDGYNYIGYLSIPSLELELPVMDEWDYTRLKLAPCRYYGAVETDDLVISAHNYPRHFGNLAQLCAGDTVDFTGVDGLTSHYQVAEVAVLPPTAIEEMTCGEYALTLFTCTYGGKSRVTVRCVRREADD